MYDNNRNTYFLSNNKPIAINCNESNPYLANRKPITSKKIDYPQPRKGRERGMKLIAEWAKVIICVSNF